jgi:hypothetical protein
MLEIIILSLSIIHAIFGVGLLAVGTPLLLILNYDFLTILKILLPCSMLINIFQIIKKKKLNNDKKLIYISLPYVLCGAFIAYVFSPKINFKLFIGFSIFIILFLKLFLKRKIKTLIKKNKISLISFAGLFHGLTNTGGALISLIFQDLKNNKYGVQITIAYTYFFYALTQYLLLNFFLKEVLLKYENIKFLLFTSIGYLLGNKVFKSLRFAYFINILNFIIFLSATYLIFSEFKNNF